MTLLHSYVEIPIAVSRVVVTPLSPPLVDEKYDGMWKMCCDAGRGNIQVC